MTNALKGLILAEAVWGLALLIVLRVVALLDAAARRLAGELPMRGLADPDEQVRMEAARSLSYAEDPAQVLRAFEVTLASSPVARIHFAPLLRRHAILLCETEIPRLIRTAGCKDLL